MNPLNRRQFLKSSTATGAGLLILPTGTLFGQNRPSNKLNIALIGVWGRGLAHYNVLKKENVVALCDVNELRFADALKVFPGAKTYVDWRKLLDQEKGIDAVVCCTPDHHHAHVAIWAMNRDKHVYMEKPIALTVEETRAVRALYLKKKNKLATQAGTQRHAIPNFQRVKEMVRDGAIGKLQGAFAWGNRQLPRPGYLPAEGSPPSTLHYDLWIGPSPMHPYNPGYFSGGPGANCLQWNMFWDFGTGQVGDMGNHTMDLAWQAIDATHPTSVEAKGDAFNPEVTPVKMEAHFEHPANDWRGPIRVSWYQGKVFPTMPKKFIDPDGIGHGAMFKGTGGVLLADFNSRMLIPEAKADLTEYKIRPKAQQIPPIGDFQEQWINACKGDPTKTSCNFDYNGLMTEQMALGLVAYRAGKKLKYDGKTGKTDDATANEYLGRKYRAGWTLNG
ncbi:MAG: Gfo/Idh/MocA family oxidoreductase [Verrucomicrobia bacterium]|nr:Gfo/Idh/MocA family oxidoreductase [Verrucomicrobiota bacterium]